MNLPTRILIADSNVDFLEGLCGFLERQEDVKVVSVVRDGQGVVKVCKETLPDVVLMDLHLPVLDSVRAVQSILAENERIKILTMSSIPCDRYALEAIKAGASGHVEKNSEPVFQAITEAIRQVVNGEVLLNPALASSILQEFHRLSE